MKFTNILLVLLTLIGLSLGYFVGGALEKNKKETTVPIIEEKRCIQCYDSNFISIRDPLFTQTINDTIILQVICGYDSFINFTYNDTIRYRVYYTGSIDSIVWTNPNRNKISLYPWYK